MRPALLAAALLLAALPSRADPPAGHELSLGLSSFSLTSFFSALPRTYAIEAAYHRELSAGGLPVRVGGGLRSAGLAQGAFPAEIFGEAQLVAHVGAWAPAAGLQLGWTPYLQLLNGRDYRPTDFYAVERSRVSSLFLCFSATPARFQVGRWFVSAFGLQLGTTLAPPGRGARTQIDFLQIGGTL